MKKLFTVFVLLLLATPALGDSAPSVTDKVASSITQGYDYIDTGNYQEAVRVFQKALDLAPKSADAYLGLGICHFRIGNNDTMTITDEIQKAVSEFQTAMQLGAEQPGIHYFLGSCYLALDERNAAEEEYRILQNRDEKWAQLLYRELLAYRQPAQYQFIETPEYRQAEAERQVLQQLQDAKKREEDAQKQAIAAAQQRAKEEKRRTRFIIVNGQPSPAETMDKIFRDTEINRLRRDVQDLKIDRMLR
jgi:tetratricopeptide (TPR) repeat protein